MLRTRTILGAATLLLLAQGCGEPDSPQHAFGNGDDTVDARPFTPPDRATPEPVGPTSPSGPLSGSSSESPSEAAPSGADAMPADGGSPDVDISDCAAALPCRLDTTDGALSVVLSAVDGEQLDGSGALRVDFAVQALSRDMPLGIDRRSLAISAGQVLETERLQLGSASVEGARDEAMFTLIAGVPINAHLRFADRPLGNPATLERLTLVLTEAGRSRRLRFSHVPIGAERTPPIDCRGLLPCEWRSANDDVTLTLTTAEPRYWNRSTRLVIDWSLSSTRPLEATTFMNALVSGDGVEVREIYGVELAGETSRDGTVLSHTVMAGEPLAGRLVLRRAPADDEISLARVEPGVAERRALRTPRWRPVFLDVPLTMTADPTRP